VKRVPSAGPAGQRASLSTPGAHGAPPARAGDCSWRRGRTRFSRVSHAQAQTQHALAGRRLRGGHARGACARHTPCGVPP